MAATTRWLDTENKEFDVVMETILNGSHSDEQNFNETTEYANWSIKKLLDENQNIQILGRDITFNYIKYSFDQISAGNQPIEDRTIKRDGKVLVYSTGFSVNYIINRNSDAKLVLRKLLSYSGKKEIEKNNLDINSDMFVWMISKVYTNNNVIETDTDEIEHILLDSVRGFKGDTDDLLTKVSAYGESVMNIISTLSFLLESKNLTQVKLDIKYDQHERIELGLSIKGTVETTITHYQGNLDEISQEETLMEAKLYLIIYLEILPLLYQAYQRDIANSEWNQEKYIEFLSSVATELQTKVNTKLELMKE